MIKKEYNFLGNDGKTNVYGIVCAPEKENKGFIQIVHDVYDHIDRYENVMEEFASYGYVSFGIDLVGHGKSLIGEDKLGVFQENTTVNNLVDDLNTIYKKVLVDFNRVNESIEIQDKEGNRYQFVRPVIHMMLGVGFGSSLIRSYCNRHKDVNALTFIGDPGFTSNIQKALSMIEKDNKSESSDDSSKKIREFIQDKYNDYINDKNKYRASYRSSLIDEIKKIHQDKLCSFEYDMNAMKKILSIETTISLASWVNTYNKYLPLYELSGYEDPVTNYSREIDSIITHFKYSNSKNIFYKYYKDNRHELLFDKASKEAAIDIVTYADNIYKQYDEMYQEEKNRIGGK